MKILSWNCRGIDNPRTISSLQEWCWREMPNIIFLMATKIDATRLEGVRNRCCFTEGLCLNSNGLSGGLGIWWRDIMVRVISFSSHYIAIDIFDGNNVVMWRAIGVYGWLEKENKHKTWSLMKNLQRDTSCPLIFVGDFTEILSENEKDRGVPRSERCIDGFRETLYSTCTRDLGFKGFVFTWQRGLDPSMVIMERFDRFLTCDQWCNMFQCHEVVHFPINMNRSDHAPLLLNVGKREENRRRKRIFCFEAYWLSSPDCEEVVKEAWKSNHTDPAHLKLASCISAHSKWAAASFGDIKRKINQAEEKLRVVQQM